MAIGAIINDQTNKDQVFPVIENHSNCGSFKLSTDPPAGHPTKGSAEVQKSGEESAMERKVFGTMLGQIRVRQSLTPRPGLVIA